MICIVLQSVLFGDFFTSKISRAGLSREWKSIVTKAKVGVYLRLSRKLWVLFYTNPSAFLYSLVQLLSTIEGFRVTAFLAVVVPMLYSVMAVCHATADVSIQVPDNFLNWFANSRVRKLLRHCGGTRHVIWELIFVQESRNCVVVRSRGADRVCRLSIDNRNFYANWCRWTL